MLKNVRANSYYVCNTTSHSNYRVKLIITFEPPHSDDFYPSSAHDFWYSSWKLYWNNPRPSIICDVAIRFQQHIVKEIHFLVPRLQHLDSIYTNGIFPYRYFLYIQHASWSSCMSPEVTEWYSFLTTSSETVHRPNRDLSQVQNLSLIFFFF